LNKILLSILILTAGINLNAQVLDTIPQTEEYAVVRAVLYYKDGSFVYNKFFDNSRNPSLQIGGVDYLMKNFTKSKEGEKLQNITQMLDYMNKWDGPQFHQILWNTWGKENKHLAIFAHFKVVSLP